MLLLPWRCCQLVHLKLLVVAIIFSTPLTAAEQRRGAMLLSEDDAPLHTDGRYIVSKRGVRVKWACLNWYGAYSEKHVVGGLENRSLDEIVASVVELGFNCIRLCYSTQAQIENPIINDEAVWANPQFKGGKRFFEVFDATLESITRAGLMVIINNHNHKSGWCCHYSQDEGLWYTPEYPESTWIESLVNMTARYLPNKMVVAMDLRNEVHDYEDTVLTWGDGDPKTDWAAAATRAGNAVLAVNPNMTIVVMALCFGIDLRPARSHPIQLTVPNRVVYETHNYLEYQFWDLISQSFIAWESIAYIGAFMWLFVLFVVIVLGIAWQKLQRPKPSGLVVVIIIGAWIFALNMIAVAISAGFYSLTCVYCGHWANRDILPLVIIVSVLAGLGLAVAIACWVNLRGFLRRKQSTMTSAENRAENTCYTPGWNSWRLARERVIGKDRKTQGLPQAEWDCGLCCALQCFILCAILTLVCTALFIFTHFATSYQLMERHFDAFWGFTLEEGHPYTAPMWMAEFGNAYRGIYWLNFMRYLSVRDIDYAYWALNGKKWAEGNIDISTGEWKPYAVNRWESEGYGIFEEDYETVRSAWRLQDLQSLMQPTLHWDSMRPCSRSVWGGGCGG